MGTEVAVSFSALRAQLENEKSSLCKIDESIKKRVQTSGRFANDRFNNSSGDYGRGGPRVAGRNSFPDLGNNFKNEDPFVKRKHETKTVFSRLSAREPDSDDDGPSGKRTKMPSAVSRELPTRAAVLRAQGDDEQARTRNRRIFGSLLGTLQKFKQEEIVLQTKEDKKAQIEKKIDEQARQEKEREQRERKSLFAERDLRKAKIRALEAKMGRVQEFEKWEESQKHLGNFILTKAKPHLYWLPKRMSDQANEKLISSQKFHEKCMTKKRVELQEELIRIEQRCLRPKGPAAKENDPEPTSEDIKRPRTGSESSDHNKDDRSKRDKFAMDVDEKEKEDSDGEEKGEVITQPKVEKDSEESKNNTSTEQGNTTVEEDTQQAENTIKDTSEMDTSEHVVVEHS